MPGDTPTMRKMLEIIWYGRAGEGVTSAASIAAEIFAVEGKYVQAFPQFRMEKNDPFMQAYNRFSDSSLKLHSPIQKADAVVILNTEWLKYAYMQPFPDWDFEIRVKKNAAYFINTPLPSQTIREKYNIASPSIYTLDANALAAADPGKPFPNIFMLTSFILWMNWIPIEQFKEHLQTSLSQRWGSDTASSNLKAIERMLKGNANEIKPAEME